MSKMTSDSINLMKHSPCVYYFFLFRPGTPCRGTETQNGGFQSRFGFLQNPVGSDKKWTVNAVIYRL